MALDVDYATRLAIVAHEQGLKWIEEAISPNDYWGYAELKRNVLEGMLVTTGEHEATRWGFRMLIEMDCLGITERRTIWGGNACRLYRIDPSILGDIQ